MAVIRVALRVEPDIQEVMRWFREDAIADLDGQTAEELLKAGRGAELIDYLVEVTSHDRA
jgi:hypothetical protein